MTARSPRENRSSATTFPHGDVAATAADPHPVLFLASNNLPPPLAYVVALIIGGAMWLCGVASVTSMARIAAILVTAALSILICLYASAFFVVTSISTIALYMVAIHAKTFSRTAAASQVDHASRVNTFKLRGLCASTAGHDRRALTFC